MTQSRTHNCGELRLADVGKTVTLAGWLENMREVGSNLAFVVLRDFYGTTQVVIESEEMMQAFKPINRESTISVTGVVRERTSKNPKQPTGEIEVVPESVSARIRSSRASAGSSDGSCGTSLPWTASCRIDFLRASGKLPLRFWSAVSTTA